MARAERTTGDAPEATIPGATSGASVADSELRWLADGTLALRLPAESGTASELAGGLALELLDARGRPYLSRALAPARMNRTAVAGDALHAASGAGVRWRRALVAPIGEGAGDPGDPGDPDDRAHLDLDVTLTDGDAAGSGPDSGLVRLDVTLRNASAASVTLRRAFPFVAGAHWWPDGALVLNGRADRYAVYRNGWQSWSYAGGLPPGTRDPRSRVPTLVAFHQPSGAVPRLPFVRRVDVVSEEMALVGRVGEGVEGVAALAGFLSADRWLGEVFVQRRQGALAAAVLLDDLTLAPGAQVDLPPLVLALGVPDELLRAYAEAVAAELHARSAPSRAPAGWCSWYYYRTGVSAAAVSENLAAAARLRSTVPLDLFQIDDGYQAAVGDWLSVNDTFPGGMAPLAARIRAAGMRPGIWLAPFTVAANSALAREHPDWLVRDAKGEPVFAGHNWESDLHGLDTTHPEAREWLRTVIATIVREWGYDYLKLDFLASAAVPGRRHDPHATRASALRDGLTLIREVAGDDALLLGCGCPLTSAVGIVDAMRIGPDSAPYWSPRYKRLPLPFAEGNSLPNLAGALRNTLTRAWMAPAWWINDPDCLLVRERGSELTPDEVRAFATAVGLTGGMVVLSDRLAALDAERLSIVQRLLPPLAERALPAEVFGFGIPERIQVRIVRPWGEWLLVGLFNASGAEREMALSWRELGLEAGAYHAVEFWSGVYLGCSESGIAPRVAPHGAAALAIRRATSTDAPLLLSTGFHIAQGAVEIASWEYDAAERTARWRTEIGKTLAGTCTLWLPDGLTPRRLTSTANEASWRREASGAVVVSARIAGAADFALELEVREGGA